MKQPIVVGVVGCGYWGPNLVRNFKGLPNCHLKAMCDVSEARLKHMKSLYSDVEGMTDFDHLVNGVGVDAVVVAAPVRHHYSLAKTSLLAGKHTLIEKPMASSSAQCEELIEIAESKGLVLMVGHTFLYSAPVRKIAEIVQAGDIGEIRYINSRRLNLGLFQKDINVAWDLAPHDISIILHILGELPLVVNCQGNAHVTQGIEDVTNISLSFRHKRFATIQSSWLEPRKIREMTIVGTRTRKSGSMMFGLSARRTMTPSPTSTTPITMGTATSRTLNKKNRSKPNASISSSASKRERLR
jgi:predicted dehydrogenase